MKKETLENIIDRLTEGTDFSIIINKMCDNELELYINGDNPCCEDWFIEISIDTPKNEAEFTKALKAEFYYLYSNNDIEDNVKMWLEAKQNGIAGVPDVVDLVENEQYKENSLKEFWEKLSIAA